MGEEGSGRNCAINKRTILADKHTDRKKNRSTDSWPAKKFQESYKKSKFSQQKLCMRKRRGINKHKKKQILYIINKLIREIK